MLIVDKTINYINYYKSYKKIIEFATNKPIELFFESANICNLRCAMCSGVPAWENSRNRENINALLPYKYFKKLESFLKTALLAHFHGFGEPLLNNRLLDMIQQTKKYHIIVDMVTNGMLMNNEISYGLMRHGVDYIYLSFDGATKDTLELIRRRANFNTIVENFIHLYSYKKANNSSYPEVRIFFIVMNQNFHELPQLVKLASRMGVSAIELKLLVTYDHIPAMHSQRRVYDPMQDDSTLQEANKIAGENGVKMIMDSYLSSRVIPSPTDRHSHTSDENINSSSIPICFEPWKTMYVRTDGLVKPCCFYYLDSAESIPMGNLNESSAADIWNGPRFRRIRRMISRGQYPYECQDCIKFNLMPKEDNTHYHYKTVIHRTVLHRNIITKRLLGSLLALSRKGGLLKQRKRKMVKQNIN